MPLTVPALRFVQKGVPMYLAAIPARELDVCSIDRWDPSKAGRWKGYQRGLDKKKIRDLARYLERRDGILPVPGLLNVRERGLLAFSQRSKGKTAYGSLTIHDDTRLWVVDMQHRREGILRAFHNGVLGDYSVPVLITEGLTPVKEAAQFYVINTQSKKMGVDLTRRLLIENDEIRDLVDVKPWELKAVQTVIHLGSHLVGNPWYQRIRPPESVKLPTHIATEKSFVPSLRMLLESDEATGKGYKHLSRFLANYWEGIRGNIPQAFEEPRNYLIQKTPGYIAFHKIAPAAYRRHGVGSPATYKRLFRALASGTKFGERFWYRKNPRGAKRYGTGQVAYSALAVDIADHIGL